MHEVNKLAEKLAGCQGKIQYSSKAAALRVVKRMSLPLDVYRCNYCRAFHIGRANK